MADVTKNKILKPDNGPFGGVPYGNLTAFHFNLITNSSGVLVDSDLATALVDTSNVRIGVLPKGFLICDALIAVSDAFDTGVTLDIGFEYVDGVDDSDVPEDADYFGNAIAASSALRQYADNLAVGPVRLAKDAYVTVLIDDDDHEAAGVLDVVVWGIAEGKL